MRRPFALLPGLLLAVLFIAGAWLTWLNLNAALPRAQWGQALFRPTLM
jgi:iron complex transport system permease protein